MAVDAAVRGLLFRRAAGLPVPPVKKIYAVIGPGRLGTAAFRYVFVGQAAATHIKALVARHDIEVDGDILDFGCGSGRVIRWFHDHPGRVVGSDYNPRLVEWCRRHLPGFSFDVNDVDPPLAHPDGRFQLVYALSVFTHLDEARQRAWMAELARVTAAGGHLIVTTHGSYYLSTLSPDQRERFRAGEAVVRNQTVAVGSNRFATYQSEESFRQVVDHAGLKVVDYLPCGAFGVGQDLWLLRKSGPS